MTPRTGKRAAGPRVRHVALHSSMNILLYSSIRSWSRPGCRLDRWPSPSLPSPPPESTHPASSSVVNLPVPDVLANANESCSASRCSAESSSCGAGSTTTLTGEGREGGQVRIHGLSEGPHCKGTPARVAGRSVYGVRTPIEGLVRQIAAAVPPS